MLNRKKRKKTEGKSNPPSYFDGAIHYEEERLSFAKKSQRTAWIIASAACFLLVVSWLGLFLLLPLKEVTPFVIRVDKNGIPDVVTAIDSETLTADEALDRYFINYYINLREGYTYQTIQKTYDLTQVYSSDQVADQFRDGYNQKDSLDNVLKKGTAMVKVVSINLDKVKDTNLATVRFEVTYTDEDNNQTTKHYSSRVAYKYNPNLKLDLNNRTDNPLGFLVTSYSRTEENL